MRTLCKALLFILVFSFTACQPAVLSDEETAAIEAASAKWIEAFRAGDWTALVELYTDDAMLLPPNEPAAVGHAKIAALFGAFPPIVDAATQIMEVEGVGDLAYVRGVYSLTMQPEGAEPIRDSGKYIEIWRKQSDGSWMLTRDMFNSSQPAAH